jgi:LPS-assembly protein
MRILSFQIMVFCAGVSLFPLKAAQAQLLTGFEEGAPAAPAKVQPQNTMKAQPQAAPPVQTAYNEQRSQSQMQRRSTTPLSPSTLLTGFGDDMPVYKMAGGEAGNQGASTESPQTPDQTQPATIQNGEPDLSNPVDLQADHLTSNEKTQTVTASGNVMLVQDDRILRADRITYNLNEDRVVASGNVVLNEANGDIHTAQEVELTDSMKSGFVQKLKTYLADGSRFTAERGERQNAEKVIMEQATYTPCEPCINDPEKSVVWQIRASKVTHHESENRISYNNARFEVYGVPVAYLPYFSHPDGTVKRKSGFLTPTFGVNSDLGFNVGSEYYWAIAPDKDMTVGIRAFTEELPLLTAEWRQRWDSASLIAQGGITRSKRTDKSGGINVVQDDEVRGHIFAKGLWDMNDKWRSGVNVQYASDDQYMRQYDFSSEDVLENEIFTERFSGRHYTTIRMLAFQDIRVGKYKVNDQPHVLPEIISSWIGEPGSMPILGGRWEILGSMTGLYREGNDRDLARASLEAGWQRRMISDTGLVTTFDADLRGDLYATREEQLSAAGTLVENTDTYSRFFPQFQMMSGYPVAKQFENFQLVLEPQVAITASTSTGANTEIPNEDSQDVQIDTANLFEPNRFPGYDRVEDGIRATYGLRAGLYGHEGSTLEVFGGQSRRLEGDNNPFPEGSGLNRDASDYVGEIFANYKNNYTLNYRFQLAEENLESERHELDATARFGGFDISTKYLYANSLEGTAITQSREQFGADIGYNWNTEWRTTAGAVQDLGESPGLRYAYAGIEHYGQCLDWGITAQRNLTDDASGESSTELMLRIGLKNLGEFSTSGIQIANDAPNTSNSINQP